MRYIYFDNAATSIIFDDILSQMPDIFKDLFANPNSIHSQGQKSRAIIEESRNNIARIINVNPDEIIFTSCATESNNTIIRGLAERYPEKTEIIISPIEHKSVLNPCKFLSKKGYKIHFLKIDKEGKVDFDDLKRKINNKTLFVSVIHANNETGVLQDINMIGKICKEKEVLFFSDTVQSFMKEEINTDLVDFFSVSGHKINAPKGIGMFFKKNSINIQPLIFGGGQERGLRSGTENTQFIKFLSDAVSIWNKNKERFLDHLSTLRSYFETSLKKAVPEAIIVSEKTARINNISCVIFPFIDAQTMVLSLDSKNVAVSSGSACSSGTPEPSYVLTAYGFKPEEALRAVRFSFGIYNKKEEVDIVIDHIKDILSKYRKFMNFS